MTQRQSQVSLLTINKFAQICRTTPRTLRFYEQKGLLKPHIIHSNNNYRFYHPNQARDFLKIKLLQSFDLTLQDIKKLLTSAQANTSLAREITKFEEEVKRKKKRLAVLRQFHAMFSEKNYFQSKLQSATLGPFILFCTTIEKGYYTKISEYIASLRNVADTLKLKYSQSEINFYLTNTYNPIRSPLEIALVCHLTKIPSMREVPHGYYFKTFHKINIMYLDYKGPYDYLPVLYQGLYRYLEKEEYAQKNRIFEQYVRGPRNTAEPYEFLTKIGFFSPPPGCGSETPSKGGQT